MPEPDGQFAGSDEPLEDVVDRHVAGRAGQDLFTPADRLADQFDDRCGLAGAGRTVNQGKVPSPKGQTERPGAGFGRAWY